MRGLKQNSDEELAQMSVQCLKLELAFWKQRASQFTKPKINKLAMKYVYKIEKALQRKEATQQVAVAEISSGSG
jgi:hypothetical protein